MDMFGGLGAFSPMGGPAEATPQVNPFTKQSTAPIPDVEDEDEWEYEYSTTETETYYVTLDLTNPSDPPKRKPAPQTGRVSARIRWINPVLLIPDDDDTQKKKKKGTRQRKNLRYRLGSRGLEGADDSDEQGNEEDEDEELDSEEEEEGGGSDSDSLDRTRRARERTNEPEVESEEEREDVNLEANGFRPDSEGPIRDPGDEEDDYNTVQISELHSKEPFVLFRGKYYKCQWHENIGTELLFMKHDPDDPNPLPSLRSLPGDVDLLAASSARIMSKEVLLMPKADKVQKPRRSKLKVKDLAIDVGNGASAKRKARAKFLEELINTKLAMGELDGVTVNAVSRKSIWKWNEHLKEQNKADIRELEKVIAKGGRGAAEAKRKMQEIEEEMHRRENAMNGGKKKSGPPAGQKKPIPGAKLRKGKPGTEKLGQAVPGTSTPVRPASGVGKMASSLGDIGSDEVENSEADSQEGDDWEDESGDGDSGQEESGEERSDEENSEGDSDDDDDSNSGTDEGSDEDGDDEDTTMYD